MSADARRPRTRSSGTSPTNCRPTKRSTEITYAKGQAILRMFEAYLGAGRFRGGIRRYMQAHAYSNATPADLWNALGAASGKRRREHLDALDHASRISAGLGDGDVRCVTATRTIALSQKRFLRSGSRSGGNDLERAVEHALRADGPPQACSAARRANERPQAAAASRSR